MATVSESTKGGVRQRKSIEKNGSPDKKADTVTSGSDGEEENGRRVDDP